MEIWKVILGILIVENVSNFLFVMSINPFWSFKKHYHWTLWAISMIFALVLCVVYNYEYLRQDDSGMLWSVFVLVAIILSALSVWAVRERFYGVMKSAYYDFAVDKIESGRIFGHFSTFLSDEVFTAEMVNSDRNYSPGDGAVVSVVSCTPEEIVVKPKADY